MTAEKKIAVIIGSLRKASYTRQLAEALCRHSPPFLRFRFVEIRDLSLYDEDLEGSNLPASWARFRAEIAQVDAVLFATPEYNRSVPGALKNALDVGSRPYGLSVWNNKPAAIVSTSSGTMGGFGANHHLRQSLVFLNMPTLQQPEAYVGQAGTLFLPNGSLVDEKVAGFLAEIMSSFAAWVDRVAMPAPNSPQRDK